MGSKKGKRRSTGYAVRAKISQAQKRDHALLRNVINGAQAREAPVDPDSPRVKVSLHQLAWMSRPDPWSDK